MALCHLAPGSAGWGLQERREKGLIRSKGLDDWTEAASGVLACPTRDPKRWTLNFCLGCTPRPSTVQYPARMLRGWTREEEGWSQSSDHLGPGLCMTEIECSGFRNLILSSGVKPRNLVLLGLD